MAQYDLIIIGGGINGACIARDAALRGMHALLLERDDFACGASSKSSKLAHGGIRYLEGLEFGLVREALSERNMLLKNAARWVKPLPFVFPVYQGDKRPLWMIKLGMYLYDLLAWGSPMPRHRNLTGKQIEELFPGIRDTNLKGGALYYDAQLDDSRLVIENILDAMQAGSEVHNRTAVVGLIKENRKVVGVRTRSLVDGTEGEARAPIVINATGAWSNQLQAFDSKSTRCHVRPTKGVHLVLPRMQGEEALILAAPQDGRVFFLMPWQGQSLLGTTDTDFEGDPSRICVTEQDVDYLMTALRHYFPNICPDKTAIISAFAGLRPLADPRQSSPSAASREHVIDSSDSGLITLVGGKYTTARKIAEQVVDRAVATGGLTAKPCTTHKIPLHTRTYNGPPLCAYHAHTAGQLTAAIRDEQARTLADWFYRRTTIGYGVCGGRHCIGVTADHFAALLGWSAEHKEQAKANYLQSLKPYANSRS